MWSRPFFACSEFPKICAGMSEAEGAIRTASDDVCIVLILAVVFPEADSTDLETSSHAQRLAETTGATKRQVGRLTIESSGVVVEPVPSTRKFFR